MHRDIELPSNVTPEQATAIYREVVREYHRRYRETHPEIILQQRIRASISLLTKHGYSVTGPKGGDD